MNPIKFENESIFHFLSKDEFEDNKTLAIEAFKTLYNETGQGNDFLGWRHLASSISETEIKDIEESAKRLRDACDIVVIIGIGGSYLGAKSVIDAQLNIFDTNKRPQIVYAGHNISEDYLFELKQFLQDKEFGIIVVSKSGTTTEPAIAFRIFKELLEQQKGRTVAAERIIAITDAEKGALKKLAEKESYKTFVIPDNVGGRYSVLTPCGLVPIAVAGCDIRALLRGASDMEALTDKNISPNENPSLVYALSRYSLYKRGKKIEILVNYHPKLHYFGEWWKQLFGESEGKEGVGIFPTTVDFTTDLHSMGQWIQEGERTIFETVFSIENSNHDLNIPFDAEDLDGLNYISGKKIDFVNKMAETGTRLAHVDGGVPNMRISIPELSPYYLGQLIYFFETACAISGYMLKINPFDQPGVEAYKKNMFALLGKPGYEDEHEKIQELLKNK